jgi:hypothetical protein
MRILFSSVLLILPTLLAISPTAASAHTWECPVEVRAAIDGSFQFDVVLRIEDVSVTNGGYSELGTQNVDDVNLVADGFCMVELPPGTELRTTVDGTLTDPEQSGTVHFDQFVCGLDDTPGASWEREVTILPATVATEPSSFSMLKAKFSE